MNSERQLSRGFQNLWREVMTLLTPHFVAVFNEAYCQRLELNDGTPAPVVESHESTDRSIVAEFSFQLAKLAQQQSISPSAACNTNRLLSDAKDITLRLIRQYESRELDLQPDLTAVERSEVTLLVSNYSSFLASRGDVPIEFNPYIPGTGFVNSCNGDLSVSTTLFEVKTVNRNIAGKDIRQLLVYLALQSATGTSRWSDAGFFNPRRALFYEFAIDSVVPLLSGGRLASEVFFEMVEYFGTRDLQIDSRF